MGSRDWIKNIISPKKVRSKQLKGSSESGKLNGVKHKNGSGRKPSKFANGKFRVPRDLTKDAAAIRIQTAYRACMARKSLRRLKGIVRLQARTQRNSVSKQASTALSYLHSWNRIQNEIRARRLSMVTEGRIKQKKLEDQIKLEAKLHDLEVEWCGGTETLEEALARINQREEAAVKRERALAYAFSHQWRANSNSINGPPEIGKANWGWSWMERWVAARPWENRALQKSPVKLQNSPSGKTAKNPSTRTSKGRVSDKIISPIGKGSFKARRLSYPGMDKSVQQGSIRTGEVIK